MQKVKTPPEQSGGVFVFEKNHLSEESSALIQLLRSLIQTN